MEPDQERKTAKKKNEQLFEEKLFNLVQMINITWNHANWTDVGSINIKINRSIFVHHGSRN